MGVRTIKSETDFLKVNYAGSLILLACILGGGTPQGLWTDHFIQIAMIPAMFIGLSALMDNRLGKGANVLSIGILLLIVLQFLPMSPPRNLITPPSDIPIIEFWTLSPSRSLDSAAFLVAILGFGLFVSSLTQASQKRLIRFVFLGLSINLVISVIQLSYSGGTRMEGVFPFAITSALFANENHFSSFVFAVVPLIAWQLLSVSNRAILFIIVTGLIVAIMFAVGSRAGMGISAGIALFSFFWFLLPDAKPVSRLVLLTMAAFIVLTALVFSDFEGALEADLRSTFFKNTISAIGDHWLFGTGFGTFPIIYPQYEAVDEVRRNFANHAHNDYLEVFLETGLFGVLLFFGFVTLLAYNMFRSPLSQAAGLSILAILIHSGLDYPLRTMAIATLFATLSAIVFSNGNGEERSGSSQR